jgi:serine protease Do
MNSRIAILACALLSACASGHKEFYQPYVDVKTLPDVQTLAPGEKPKVFSSSDLDRDVKIAISRGFKPIGHSSFNGKMESESAVVQQAQQTGAVLVLVSSKFVETRSITTPLFIPNNQTTYSSGSVYGNYGSANYSGMSTTYGTTVVPITTQQQRYDQTAVFFVQSTRKLKFGLFPKDLTPELRSKLERNTGALIDIVAEESPAFAANVLPGDVLIEINEVSVLNAKHAGELMQAAHPADRKVRLKVLRNGAERVIELLLNEG